MNENEIDRIAAAANALRPDWPVSSLRTLLAKPELSHKTRRDVAVALAWVACESKTKTPARVLEAGPWWAATNIEGGNSALRNPKREEACETCGRRETEHAGEFLGDHEFRPLDHGTRGRREAADRIDAARAELAAARTRLCTHGIPANVCNDCRAETTTTETTTTETTEEIR